MGKRPDKARGAVAALFLILGLWSAAALSFGQGGHGQGRLTGIVLDDEGDPIPGATVALRLIEPGDVKWPGFSWRANRGDSGRFETKTNAQGAWALNGLATGVWEVRVSKGLGYGWATRWVKVLGIPNNPKVEIRLDKLKTGSYRVEPGLLDEANARYAKGEWAAAVDSYRDYLGKDPDAILVTLAVGVCLTELGRLEEAAETFGEAADRTSSDPGDKELCALAWAGLAESYFKLGDLDRAAEGWKRASQKTDWNEIFAENVGEILFAQGRAPEALEYLRTAERLAPEQAEIKYKMGLVHLKLNDRDSAKACFAKVVETEPRTRLGREARKILADLAKQRPR
jgi:predicted Zn-dependent protease